MDEAEDADHTNALPPSSDIQPPGHLVTALVARSAAPRDVACVARLFVEELLREVLLFVLAIRYLFFALLLVTVR